MSKRRATNQITKENCEDEDECDEESGEFQKADQNEIANRVIRTARRRSSNVQASPLPSFAGFGSTSNNSSFAFLNEPKASEPKDESTKADKLKTLNLCFVNCIKKHLNDNPYAVLIPVLKDYEKHFSAISLDNVASAAVPATATKITVSAAPAIAQPPKTDPPAFNIFSTTSTSSPRIGAGLFNFSNDSKSDKTGETSQPKPSFSFAVSSSEAPKTSGFSFGLNSNTPSFGSKPEPVKTTNNGNDANNDGEPSDEPPQFDFVAPGEDGSTFEMRCKVFFKKDGQFASIGVGTLFLKPVAGGKTQLITRADTSQGSVLLNLILTPDLPLQKTGKNNVLMVCVPTPEAEPPPVPVLIRVKNEEERDRLLSEMQRLQES